jgi:hypothetical protein
MPALKTAIVRLDLGARPLNSGVEAVEKLISSASVSCTSSLDERSDAKIQ